MEMGDTAPMQTVSNTSDVGGQMAYLVFLGLSCVSTSQPALHMSYGSVAG